MDSFKLFFVGNHGNVAPRVGRSHALGLSTELNCTMDHFVLRNVLPAKKALMTQSITHIFPLLIWIQTKKFDQMTSIMI